MLTLVSRVLLAAALAVPSPDGLSQSLDPRQEQATGPAVLEAGHVDVGPRYRDGAWTVQIHDDERVPPVWRSPDDAVIRVRDAARQAIPDDPAYRFLGEAPGTSVHVLPQTQQEGVVWLGWNTQDPGVLEHAGRGVTMNLRGVHGPGRLTVFLQSGTLGAPQVLWSTDTAYPQALWVDRNTHTHANWVFGRPGVYLVALDVTAELAGGGTATASATLRFAVGDATDPDQARAAALTLPPASPSPAAAAVAGGDAVPGWLAVLLGLAAVLLVALLIGVAVRGAAVRRRAERERGAA
ncbi:choice-of-anchor M domain-containing protein [Catenuloplanes atrovinosus]|uniref:Surface-anchored protein n=1 Tax=Catenuloplanes atrovinosus TaxID=137266 RepID=A0AAE4CDI2_9ACTN|nr:choice-of-anchor M domain-containing protein [Catenuloplanes atrovinosus]MDR7277545.1 surface-anchored protein [Catenuloplanes atrovinosus]